MIESLFALFLMTNLTLQTTSLSVPPHYNINNIYNIESKTESLSPTESTSIESPSLTESTSLKEKMYHNFNRKSEKEKKDD
ncbi:MAG: hypothetical protein ACP5QP_03805 [Brevinematia bacterium]